MTLLAVLALIVLALAGTPLFVVLFLATALAYSQAGIDLANIFVVMSDLLEKPYLLPIPLFTLAGFMLARSGAPGRVVRFAEAICGWIPGGLAVLCVATCAFLTTFTGASGVTIIALGGMLYPLLRERSYPEGFSRGLITSSGSLGLLFFPALPIFLYVTVYSLATDGMAPLSPMRVFLAGLFPGLLMMGLLSEILTRTYHEAQDKPIYVVRQVLQVQKTPDAADIVQTVADIVKDVVNIVKEDS